MYRLLLVLTIFACNNPIMLRAQRNLINKKYVYSNTEKNDLAQGTSIELKQDSVVFVTTFFRLVGIKQYRGRWERKGNKIFITKLEDINVIIPMGRKVIIDTFATKKMQLIIKDDAGFTKDFPAEIQINNGVDLFVKQGDTLNIDTEKVYSIRIKVEGYIQNMNIYLDHPVLIEVQVKNTYGTLYAIFDDLELDAKSGNLYYKGTKLKCNRK